MRSTAVLTITLGLAVITLSGCAAAATGTASGAPAPTASSASGSSAAGLTTAIDVCALLPASTVSSVSGQTFVSSKTVQLGKGIYSCGYQPGNGYNWSITIYEPSSGENFGDLTGDLGGASAVTSLSGVGDKAVISGVGVAAMFGKEMIEVGYPTTPDNTEHKDAYIGIAKAAIAAVG
jgi:hypothetical protein